jgi:hypothetical protein
VGYWQFWAIEFCIFLVGFLLAAILRTKWTLALPPIVAALWIFHVRRMTDMEPEVGWFGLYLAWAILIMAPDWLASRLVSCLVACMHGACKNHC